MLVLSSTKNLRRQWYTSSGTRPTFGKDSR